MIYTVVICDECGCLEVSEYVQKTHMICWLREKGWSFGKRCLCPKCSGKRKKNG